MEYNIYFDTAAGIGFLGMIFAVLYRKTATTSSGKFFLMILCVGFMSSIFDIMSISSFLGEVWMYLANLAYLACRAWSAMSFCFYIIGITDNWHKLKEHGFLHSLLYLPLASVIVLLATNYWTKWMFMVKGGVYQRGPFINYGIMYWVTIIYFLIALIYIIKYHRFFTKQKLIALLSIYPLGTAALVAQSQVAHLLIEIFFNCVACYLVMIMVERPEEFFEPEIGLKKYMAFSLDAEKAVVTKKKVTIVYAKIVNEQTISSRMNYDEIVDIRKSIGNIIKDTAHDFSMKGDCYWLGSGKYATVLTNTITDSSESFAMTLRRRLNVPIKCSFGIIELYSNVALIRCPEDVQTTEMCIGFFESFYRIEGMLTNVMVLSDLPNRREFEIRMHMDSILKEALLKGTFEVYYQPIYSVKEKAFRAAEALVRLKDSTYGYIAPDLFLSEAEKNGTIHKIGDIVMDQVCSFIASSDFEKLGLDFIEVNLSVTQCMHEDLPIHIMDALKKYSVSPSKINFDITETVDAYSHKMMEDNIRILKEYGISISLDDFGSGYSSADNVTKMPLDNIKLDRSVVSSVDNPQFRTFYEHTISMIKDMKRKVVVEGVETKEKMTEFENYLCDYIQGYYFSKPLPKDEFISFLADNENNSFSVKEPETIKSEEPATEEPVAEEPVTEEPVAEESVVEEPVTEEPVSEEPVAEESVTEENPNENKDDVTDTE